MAKSRCCEDDDLCLMMDVQLWKTRVQLASDLLCQLYICVCSIKRERERGRGGSGHLCLHYKVELCATLSYTDSEVWAPDLIRSGLLLHLSRPGNAFGCLGNVDMLSLPLPLSLSLSLCLSLSLSLSLSLCPSTSPSPCLSVSLSICLLVSLSLSLYLSLYLYFSK